MANGKANAKTYSREFKCYLMASFFKHVFS